MTSFWPPPDTSKAAFIAPTAAVIGDVSLGIGVSVWYSAVVRADVAKITIGDYSNIQDGAVIHGEPGIVTVLEDHVTVGHGAVIHAAYIERGCLIGVNAVVWNGVRVGAGSIIGAGAVVTKDVPPRCLMVGIPARKSRDISAEEARGLIQHAQRYTKLALVHAGKGTDIGFTSLPD
ncbi:MAG: Protein YrdA [Chroococcopsis gigantea SAG 12.99]|jgi:carbonic anhydrase/acetyltransferase-like protein (isoleucine patch superfamily)|nr:Protein YrdA [Chroococcopsis gigantea SAG 12.99]